MTTIRLRHGATSNYNLEIYGATVEEDLDMEYDINFAYPKTTYGAPTATDPRREVKDLKTMNRVFTITGYIDGSSCKNASWDDYTGSNKKTAPDARQRLSDMARYGGNCIFTYGIQHENGMFTSDENKQYYYGEGDEGFNVYISKLKITEHPEEKSTDEYDVDAVFTIPSKYHVIITMFVGYETGTV